MYPTIDTATKKKKGLLEWNKRNSNHLKFARVEPCQQLLATNRSLSKTKL